MGIGLGQPVKWSTHHPHEKASNCQVVAARLVLWFVFGSYESAGMA